MGAKCVGTVGWFVKVGHSLFEMVNGHTYTLKIEVRFSNWIHRNDVDDSLRYIIIAYKNRFKMNRYLFREKLSRNLFKNYKSNEESMIRLSITCQKIQQISVIILLLKSIKLQFDPLFISPTDKVSIHFE